jgi:Type I phosphodiesterase / nucleotide pyrophosphatase
VRKLVLAVIDGLKPSMLERAVAAGSAPALKAIMDAGSYVDNCVAAFPSVTPACAASIATGETVDRHLIPSMNWFHRAEHRYVEYGSSFQASRRFGLVSSLLDTVYNMNLAHLSREVDTVFESLDDAGVRTAGTTYLMYRGRHRHEASQDSALARLATSTYFKHAVWGPQELFYADIFASRKTGCRGQLGLPGARDQHAGCVAEHLVREDLFDFLLLSLPDNDTYSHKNGPHAQVSSIAVADRQLRRMMDAAGGIEAFLDDHGVIVMADHSHATVEAICDLNAAFEDWDVLPPNAVPGTEAHVALCPSSRSAQIYLLDEERRGELTIHAATHALALDGVELAMHRSGGEGVIRSARGQLRFRPDGDVQDAQGVTWSLEGDLRVLAARIEDGRLVAPDYPDALGRAWAALACPAAGDVLLSATPGWEFQDWGGSGHIAGGSHGSLHASDSLGALLWTGCGPDQGAAAREQWTIRDPARLVREHFGVTSSASHAAS